MYAENSKLQVIIFSGLEYVALKFLKIFYVNFYDFSILLTNMSRKLEKKVKK